MKAPNRVNNLARLTKLFQSVPYRTALNDTTQHIRHPPQNATYMTRDPTAHDLDIMYTRFVRFRLRHYRVRVHTQKVTECSPLATLGHTHTHTMGHTQTYHLRANNITGRRAYILAQPLAPLSCGTTHVHVESCNHAAPSPRNNDGPTMPPAALALPLSQKVSTSPSPSRSSASSSSSCLAISRASSSSCAVGSRRIPSPAAASSLP